MVFSMHGVVLDAGQAYVVLPYMDNGNLKNYLPKNVSIDKEGVLLRNVSPSLVLSDHFPGGGILELQCRSGKERPFMV